MDIEIDVFLECRDCNMKFNSKQALVNHIEKFWSQTKWSDQAQLKKIAEDSQAPPPALDQFYSFLKGGSEAMGGYTLEDVRMSMKNDPVKAQELHDDLKEKKVEELKHDLQKHVDRTSNLRQSQKMQEREHVELMKEVSMKKEREIRSNMEQQEIEKLLKHERQAKPQNPEKIREVNRIRVEREALKIREIEFIEEVEQAQRAGNLNASAKVAYMRDMEQERQRLLNEFEDVKKDILPSNVPQSHSSKALPQTLQSLQDRYVADVERLNALKNKKVDRQDADTYLDSIAHATPESRQRKRDLAGRKPMPGSMSRNHFMSDLNQMHSQNFQGVQVNAQPQAPAQPPQPQPQYFQQPFQQMPPQFPPYPPPQMFYPPPPWLQQPPANPETQVIAAEIKKLQKALQGRKADNQNRSIQGAINQINSTLNQTNMNAMDAAPEQRAINQLAATDARDLQLLGSLPQNSEVYETKLGQYKDRAQQRMNMEALLQEQQLARMRREMDRESFQQQRINDQQRYLEEQKSQMQSYAQSPMRQSHSNIAPIEKSYYSPDPAGYNQPPPVPIRDTYIHDQPSAFQRDTYTPINSKGIGVRVEALNNYTASAPIKFQAHIMEGSQIAIDAHGTACKQPTGAQDAIFEKNFYNNLIENEWQDQLYVVILVQERNETVAWSVYQISDPESRLLNFGTYELNLFYPPVIVPFGDPSQISQHTGSVKVTIYEPNSDNPEDMGQYVEPKYKAPFIENLKSTQQNLAFFEKGAGIDLYIDAARFLPDNITCTKLIVKAFTSNLEKVGTPKGGLPELESSVYSPVFNFRMEWRLPAFDPTTTLMISLETIDSSSGEVRIIGYSVLNLFLTANGKVQPTNPADTSIFLNKGNFQLPIYCAEPYRKPPFSLESFSRLERIPGASLLVRVLEAALSEDGTRALSVQDVVPSEWYLRGIVVVPPHYETGAYNTALCMPTKMENIVLQERQNRPDMSVRESTVQIQRKLGYRLELTSDELLDWIDSKIQVGPRTPIVEMKFFARYNPRIGFKFAADAIHNAPKDSYYIILYGLNPPGALYQDTVRSSEVQFTTLVDWNSSVKTPVYMNGFYVYPNVAFDRNLSMIIDVRMVNISRVKPEVTNVGWAVLPIFEDNGYVDSGIYQLPLFKGAVPQNVPGQLAQNIESLNTLASKKNQISYTENTSVLVRLLDCQRDGHFSQVIDINRMNYKYVPKELLAKFSYNAAAHTKAAQTKRLKSIIQGNMTEDSFQLRVNTVVAEKLGLNHILN